MHEDILRALTIGIMQRRTADELPQKIYMFCNSYIFVADVVRRRDTTENVLKGPHSCITNSENPCADSRVLPNNDMYSISD